MKRFLLSILMVVIGLSAFSQSPSVTMSLRATYPLVVGERTANGIIIGNSALYALDLVLDSIPCYEIGEIDNQVVLTVLGSHSFYVRADSLHSPAVTYSCNVVGEPQGRLSFDCDTGLFSYVSADDEYQPFVVTFAATNGTDVITEDVEFQVMPTTTAEETVFDTRGVLPDAGDYTIVATTTNMQTLNTQPREARSISISGKDVVFDDDIHNNVWGLNGCPDIRELNIYAERLIIRSSLSFPQTDITIYARELIFEDNGKGVASINTTPLSEQALANGEGVDGADAGSITLYVGRIKADAGKRFRLHGARGQSTNRNGTPGRGGNGGVVTSTIDVADYCDFVRGHGGVQYDVADDGSTSAGPVISHGEMGTNGSFRLIAAHHAYLHPYYIAAVMRHANDAFINNCTAEVLQTCREYRALISDYLGNGGATSDDGGPNEGIDSQIGGLIEVKSQRLANGVADLLVDDDEEERLELRNDLISIEAMLLKLEQGLDYFGNPRGWVPLLSFEVYLKEYENEIDRAIPTLYTYYWLNRIDQTLQNKVRASQAAAETTQEQIDGDILTLNDLIGEIPILEDETRDVTASIASVTQQLEALQKKLLRRAKRKVRHRNRIRKIFGAVKAVANVLPITGTIGATIGAGLDVALNLANTISTLTGGEDYSSYYADIDNAQLNTSFTANVQSSWADIKTGFKNHKAEDISKACNSMSNTLQPMVANIKYLSEKLMQKATSNAEVQQELNKLMAASKQWQSLNAQIIELNARKEALLNRTNQVFSDLSTTVSDIGSNTMALDAFNRQIQSDNSKRDLNAMLYLEDMEQRAKSRLLKYHYYLRKAYEYRMLKPYGGNERDFNITALFKRFEKLSLACDSVVDEAAYNALGVAFRDVLSDMINEIITEYSQNQPEQTYSSAITIPKKQLAAINAGEDVVLNFYELGLFPSDRENVRIVDIDVEAIEAHATDDISYSGGVEVKLTHSGTSEFRKDGNLYWFNHMTTQTRSPHIWGINYDAVNGKAEAIRPSAAQTSLLASIVGGGTDLMMFSRPSAWSDITLSKNVYPTGGADVVIDSLVLKLTYDFTRRPLNLRHIDITANDGLMPYIACSQEDVNGRSDGYATMYRSFANSSQSVTFTAADKYEAYRFKNWTNRAGNVVSAKNTLTVGKNKDQFYIANYEYMVPQLSVPDTLRLRADGGQYSVSVANAGHGETEMEWEASDSLSTWVRVVGEAAGVDAGTFTISCDANVTSANRVDSIEVFAAETDELSKVIYIIQEADLSHFANVLYADRVEAVAGQQKALPIRLRTDNDVAGVSMTLKLPSGMTLAKTEDGDVVCRLNENRAKSNKFSVTSRDNGDGSYGLRIWSPSGTLIKGSEGELATVFVKVPPTMPKSDYAVCLSNNMLTVGSQSLHLPDTEGTISLVDARLGDVNGDDSIDLTDAIMIIYSSLGVVQRGFIVTAADVNGDGSIDLTDAIMVIYQSLGASPMSAPRRMPVPQ